MNTNFNKNNTTINLYYLCYLLLIIIIFSGCGSPESSKGTPPKIPSLISGLQSINVLGNLNSLDIHGTVSFIDPDADVVSIKKFIKEGKKDSKNEYVLESADDLSTLISINGQKAGSINITFTLNFDNNPIETRTSYTLQVIVVDNQGNESDPSYGEIIVCPSGPEASGCQSI